MNVVFLKDVPKYGRRNEVKRVSDGYALNYLIPQKLAVMATPEMLAHIETEKAKEKALKHEEEQQYVEIIRMLQKNPVAISASVNEKGHLFKAIHEKEVAEAIKAQVGKQIPVDMLQAEHQIKEAGDHRITAHIGGEKYVFKVNVLKA